MDFEYTPFAVLLQYDFIDVNHLLVYILFIFRASLVQQYQPLDGSRFRIGFLTSR